ncbi:MAG: hypothetical protein M3Q95_15320 [Bacteroidota bacterium]|nr:hypothetical protein [Bacteroidota bacterium]
MSEILCGTNSGLRMKLPSLFKTPQHKTFNLKTRYYNAEKEAFEERVRNAQREGGLNSNDAEAAKARIRQKFQGRRNVSNHPDNRSRILRIFALFILLSAIFYWLLK